MREIKFRGLRTDGKGWAYGVPLMCNYCGVFMVWAEKSEKMKKGQLVLTDVVNQAEVIPETVGQFTGLTDKNGKEIFEGDVVKDVDTEKIFEIIYQHHMFLRYERKPMYMFYTLDGDCVEVIGNVHEGGDTE